jgi:hypothetical protein
LDEIFVKDQDIINFPGIKISCRDHQQLGRINRSLSTIARMTESNLIEFRSVGGQEVGDFESNRDDPGTLDVGWQGHRGYRGAAINRGLLEVEPENKQV